MLSLNGLDEKHERSVYRLVTNMKERSKAEVLASERNVESYVRYLNHEGHFAVVFYSTQGNVPILELFLV